ncbi:MAG: ATP-binding protein, partial [Ilumatobacteraceae bacterium]
MTGSVGREREVTRALTALRGGPGVYLVGPAGVGKSRLAETISQALEAEGWSVVRARATTGASELPLGAFLTQLGAAERFLTPMFAEIRERILEEANGRPVLISVDDVDLLDDSSAVLVHQMVAAGEAKVMATLRAGRLAPNELLDLWQRGELHRMDVGPFGRAEAERVADAIADRPLDAATHQRLWEVSAGNALFIHVLVTTALEQGTIVDDPSGAPDGAASISQLPLHSPRLIDVVRGRLAHLDDGRRHAMLHLAFAEPCGPAELASVADTDTLAALEAAELVTVELDRNRLVLRLAHPLYGEVVRLGTGHLQRRAVLASLARDLQATGARRRSDIVKLARLAVDGGVEVPISVLTKAASIAFAAGDLVLTERLSRTAFDATGSYQAGWSLANALLGLGEATAAREAIERLRPIASDSGERLGVALIESQLEFWVAGDLGRATEINEVALTRDPIDDPAPQHPVSRDEVLANQAVYEAVSANYDEAWRLAEPLLQDRGPDQVLIRAALAAAHALRIGGRPLDALGVVQRALDAYAVIGQECINLSERLMLALRSLCHLQAGDVAAARADANRAMLNGINEAQLGVAAIGLAAIEVFAGRPATARPAIEQAITHWSRSSGAGISQRWVHCAAALVHGTAGDTEAAAGALRAYDADTHDAHVFDFGAELGRARMLAANGHTQAARD